ncbi:hypothetical protein RBU55_13960 [Pseudomonas chlororaphis subsp. aurantiaca]|uniref:hypothetical protein n=1 Tax=Pseudomonas chlororaphis TaxID=587753 RepID=UPI0027DE4B86|nr:hypothetical protein [Pseudomonas chlororaphis]WMJ02620.1 hypothetical protein RBU55_13960 [Pseudomonas chlororaphis subsp. aurantiaca]
MPFTTQEHGPMLSAQEACAIVLALYDGTLRDGKPERFVIQSCELSSKGDYWIVRANTEDCVLHGMTQYCYVGVNAHLVNVVTGARETVANCFTVEEYLQDKYDLQAAAGNLYVLTPAFARDDKPALINLRQKLACSYPETLKLLGEQRQWLTGKRRQLQEAQRLLASQGIATSIELQIEAAGAIAIGVEAWHSDAVLKALRSRLR